MSLSERRPERKFLIPQLSEYASGHLAACHHPQNVTAEEIARATRSDLSPLSSGDTAPAPA